MKPCLLLFVSVASAEEPNGASAALAESDSQFFDELIKERDSGSPDTELWDQQAQAIKTWRQTKHDQVNLKYTNNCEVEHSETEAWIERLKEEMNAEAENDSTNALDAAVKHLIAALNGRILELRSTLERLNDHIKRVNDIFSTAHLVRVTDLLTNIFSLRTSALALRSQDTFEDPIFNQIPMDPMVESFIDLSSYASSMEALADEAQSHLERAKESGHDDGDLTGYCVDIQNDVNHWKEMKVTFEAEREILANLREDLMALYKLRTQQLADLKATLHDVSKLPRAVNGEDKPKSRHQVIPLLEQHLSLTAEACNLA